MTTTYIAVVSGAFPTNDDYLATEITAPSTKTIKIKRIRITQDDGTQTVTADAFKSVSFIIESVAGTNGTSFTPISLDGNAPAATSTVKIGPMTKGTVATTINTLSIHSGTDYFWQAADEDDKIVLTPSSIFGVVINPAA